MSIYGYLRVSTNKQDTEKNKEDILRFAKSHELGKVVFVEEIISGKKSVDGRKLGGLIDKLGADDVLLVPELSRLSRNMLSILEVVRDLTEKKVRFYSCKENFSNNDNDIASTVILGVFSMLADVERQLISIRTKEALRARKESGMVLGRPKGSGKSKLDKFEDEIRSLLALGIKKKNLALKYEVTPQNLNHWMNKKKIK